MSAGYMRRCSGKERFGSKSEASDKLLALASAAAVSRSRMSTYRCDQCLGWHVGGSANRYISRRRRSGKRPNKRMRGRV